MTKNKNKDLEKNSSLFESEITTEAEIETEESTNPTNLENEQNTLTEVFDNGYDKLFDVDYNTEKEEVVETISINSIPQPQTTSNITSNSKTYKVVLIKESSFIVDDNGNGRLVQKTPSTQNIKIGDEITLQNEE